MNTSTVTYRRSQITLTQDAAGFWGWTIGKNEMLPMFAHRDSALRSAQRFVDDSRR